MAIIGSILWTILAVLVIAGYEPSTWIIIFSFALHAFNLATEGWTTK